MPLKISGSFSDHPSLAVEPADLHVELQPNSIEIMDLEVAGGDQLDLGRYELVRFEWSAEYDQGEVVLPDLAGATFVAVHPLTPASQIRYRDDPIIVDGALTEWGWLPVTGNEEGDFQIHGEGPWTGPADCSWRFGVTRDDDYLYVGIEVRDDQKVYLAEKTRASQQDGVEVHIDARPDPMRSLSRLPPTPDMKHTIKIRLAPGNTSEETFVVEPERLQELGVQALGVFTEGGHSCEVAIPLEYIEQRQGDDWDGIRINVTVGDRDGDGEYCQLWWRPPWNRLDSYPGSGTFVRK